MEDTLETAEPECEVSDVDDVETLEETDTPPKRKLNNLWNFFVHNKVDSSPREIDSQKKENLEREKSEPKANGSVPKQQEDDGTNERDEKRDRSGVQFDSENEQDIILPGLDNLNGSLSQKTRENNHINKTERCITPVESHNKDRDGVPVEKDKIEKHNDIWTGLPRQSLQGDIDYPVADLLGTAISQGKQVTVIFLFNIVTILRTDHY